MDGRLDQLRQSIPRLLLEGVDVALGLTIATLTLHQDGVFPGDRFLSAVSGMGWRSGRCGCSSGSRCGRRVVGATD